MSDVNWTMFLLTYLRILSSILWKAGLPDMNSLSFLVSWTVFISLSTVVGSLAEYSSLGWHPGSFRSCTLFQALLAFKVSTEKLMTILVEFLYMWFLFTLLQLLVLFLCSAYLVLKVWYAWELQFPTIIFSIFWNFKICLGIIKISVNNIAPGQGLPDHAVW